MLTSPSVLISLTSGRMDDVGYQNHDMKTWWKTERKREEDTGKGGGEEAERNGKRGKARRDEKFNPVTTSSERPNSTVMPTSASRQDN